MGYLTLITKYIKKQPKRTLSIVIGIILTSMLLTLVGVITYSLKSNMLEDYKKACGDYHVEIKNIDKEKIDSLKKNKDVESTALNIYYGNFTSKDGKAVLLVKACEEGMLKSFGDELKKGVFPKHKDEICVDEWFLENMKITQDLGQYIDLNIRTLEDKENKEHMINKRFKIVGILKTNLGAKACGMSTGMVPIENAMVDLPIDLINYNLLVKTKEKNVLAIGGAVKNIQHQLNISEEDAKLNNLLFKSMESVGEQNLPSIILGAIVVIAAIAVIYNIFNMSVLNRIRDYGVLRCLGFRKSKIRKLVLKEAVLLSIISTPIGILLGCLLSKGMYRRVNLFMDTVKTSNVVYSPVVILGIFLITLITVIVSILMPARKASKVSPLEAVRNTNMYSSSSKIKNRKWHSIIEKLFKTEGLLAYKNLWRSKKRTYITIFSLSFSVILFICFTYFFPRMPMIDLSQMIQTGQFQLSFSGVQPYEECYDDKIIDRVKNIQGVKDIIKLQTTKGNAILNKDQVVNFESIKDKDLLEVRGEKYVTPCVINGYDKEMIKELNKYISSGSINEDGSLGEDEVIIYKSKEAVKYHDLKPGSEVTLSNKYEKQKNIKQDSIEYKKFKVKAVVSKAPWEGDIVGIFAIVGDNAFKKFTKIDGYRNVFVKLEEKGDGSRIDDKLRKNAINDQLEAITSEVKGAKLVSYYKEMEKFDEMIRNVNILMYSFIGCVGLIGVLNIINTMSTNIILRIKEFGTLKAIGFNKKHIKKLVLTEGMFYGIISSIFGGIISLVICFALYKLVPDMKGGFPIIGFVAPLVITIILSMIASIIPLKKVNKLNAIEAINDI